MLLNYRFQIFQYLWLQSLDMQVNSATEFSFADFMGSQFQFIQ